MLRKTIAVALLCLTLLFCGLDTSAVGHPAEPETALHAMVHGHGSGARDALVEAAGAFVALGMLTLIAVSLAGPRPIAQLAASARIRQAAGWRTAHETRGPPALA